VYVPEITEVGESPTVPTDVIGSGVHNISESAELIEVTETSPGALLMKQEMLESQDKRSFC
jgi:hypothetical protein